MPLTVGDLLQLPGLGLKVVAGASGLDRTIRWAHTSELADPTRWLSGGELLLTTGLGLKGSPNAQRAYLNRLAKAGLAGLGLGVGLGFDEVPGPVLRAADRTAFPVLEVPYQVPFIAITEAVSSALTEERVKELEMSEVVHDRLAHLVGSGASAEDVLHEIVALAPGWAYLFSMDGEQVAAAASPGCEGPNAQQVWRDLPARLGRGDGPTTSSALGPAGASVAVLVDAGKHHEGVLAFGKPARLEVRDRIVVRHAATLLGLLLASRRAVADVERRVAGDLLVEAVGGHVAGEHLQRRLEAAGFPPGAGVRVVVLEVSALDRLSPQEAAAAFEAALVSRVERARVAVVDDLLVGLVVAPDIDRLDGVTTDLAEDGDALPIRMGVGEEVSPENVRISYRDAALALHSAPRSLSVVTTRDLGAYRLLLENQSPEVLQSLADSVLGAVIRRDREKGSELLPSVRAFVEAGGRWEEAAQSLGVHRHTLRYRLNQAQELLDRDLFSAEDRMEIWLACKAADLLDEPR